MIIPRLQDQVSPQFLTGNTLAAGFCTGTNRKWPRAAVARRQKNGKQTEEAAAVRCVHRVSAAAQIIYHSVASYAPPLPQTLWWVTVMSYRSHKHP